MASRQIKIENIPRGEKYLLNGTLHIAPLVAAERVATYRSRRNIAFMPNYSVFFFLGIMNLLAPLGVQQEKMLKVR